MGKQMKSPDEWGDIYFEWRHCHFQQVFSLNALYPCVYMLKARKQTQSFIIISELDNRCYKTLSFETKQNKKKGKSFKIRLKIKRKQSKYER